MLSGLLAPPSGPNQPFVEELLGAYAWISLVLVVLTMLLRRASGLAVLIAALLLLTAGAWTFGGAQGSILQAPVPTGIPAVGLRASLMDIFWPSTELLRDSVNTALPNIWRPAFTLSYALTLVVLSHAAHARRRSWLSVMTLATLVGFLGLASTSLVPIVFVLWAGLEAIWLIQSRRAGSVRRSDVIRPATGLALAALLLLAGSFSYLVLGDSAASGLSLGMERIPGSLAAVRHARPAAGRHRPPWPWPSGRCRALRCCWPGATALVLALAVGAGVLLLAHAAAELRA